MNRRFLALALAGTLTLSLLTACGGGDAPDTQTTPPAAESVLPNPESSAPVMEEEGMESSLPESSAPAAEESQNPDAETSSKPSAAPTTKPTSKPTSTPTQTTKPSATPAPTPESTPQVNVVQSVWNDISKLDLPNLTQLDDSTFTALYGISTSDLVSYVCYIPAMGVHATEFFVAEVKDGKMDTVKAGIEKRQADLDAQWSQYLPQQYDLVKNYKLVTNGNYVLFAISEHADEAVTAFNTYTK